MPRPGLFVHRTTKVVTFHRMTLGERVKTAREHAELDQPALVAKIQRLFPGCLMSQQTISKIERGGPGSTSAYVVKIAVACGVSPLWLDSEKGPMVVPDGQTVVISDAGGPNISHLEGVIQVIEKKLPPSRARLTAKERARLIAQAYALLRPDGSIDMSKVLDVVVNPAKRMGQQGGRESARKRKGGAR